MEAHPMGILNFVFGGISGMLAKSIVAPIDRIKIFYLVILFTRFPQENLVIIASFKI